MNNQQAVLIGAAIGFALWMRDEMHPYSTNENPITGTGNLSYLEKVSFIGSAANWLSDLSTRGAAYIELFTAAEAKHGMPSGLLARVAWQESRYRPDIVAGKTKSTVGATGIMQLMPSTAKWLGVEPTDPAQSIQGAGRYLASLYSQFKDWGHALMAYNWGPGNVRSWLKGSKQLPASVKAYSNEILADLGMK